MTVLAALEAAVGDIEANPQLNTALALGEVRQSVADDLAKLNRRDAQRPPVAKALAVITRLAKVGALDLPLADDDRDRLVKWESLGWPGLLASMLLTPAWRWSSAPVLSDVPDWMWGEYAEWLFASPNPLVSPEDCTIYASHVSRHSEELARWAQRNLGSPSVKAAVEAFARSTPLRPLRHADVNSRPAAEARAKILSRVHGKNAVPFDPVLLPRAGRALRVGFVARTWDLDADACAALALFEQLPADRVERILFSLAEPTSAFGWHCRDRAQEFNMLPGDLAGQVSLLRDMNLDVVVFAGDLAQNDDLSRVPLFRVAPVQIVREQAERTTGLPEAHVQIVPAYAANPARFSERLAVLPAGGASFALRRGGDPELAYAREDLGFSEDAVVLVAVLPTLHGAGESLGQFAQILAQAPQARLVLHVLPGSDVPALGSERFCAVVEAVMKQWNVALDRISMLAPEQATFDETRAIVRLGDVFLATVGADIWSAEAMAIGIPVVGHGGAAAEWLKADDFGELVADSQESYVAVATALVGDADRRAALKTRLQESLKNGLSCADALAQADAFLGLVENAFDQLEANGRSKFMRNQAPITAGMDADVDAAVQAATAALANGDIMTAVDSAQKALAIRPRDGQLRALYGRALLAEGRPERASVYLLAAVEQAHVDAPLWFDLATSLRNEGKNSEATQALESALRLDPKRADGWLMLIDLAEMAGAFDIAQQAYQSLKEIQPDHPQLADLALRLES